jgi:hypothetical protein
MRNDNSDVIEWVKRCLESFDACYATFIRFTLISGLRKTEAIEAFNLTVKLGRKGKLNEYYNAELESLLRNAKTFNKLCSMLLLSLV